jgi:sugar phosphate isomerase/epimerase
MTDITMPRPTDVPRELTRRSLFGMAAGLAAAWPLAARLEAASKIPIAVQLYSIRADCKANFDDALAKVAAMGFKGVEFAGYYGYADRPVDLRKRLNALKLKAAGTHIGLETMQGDALQKTIDFHKALGCKFLIVPSNAAFTDPEKSKALADTFNTLAVTLKKFGMACGYHNHTREFTKDGDKTYWDLFAERTTKDVILQQDCGWTFAAGFDPVEYVRKYPGRTKTAHFKPTVRKEDVGKKAILGQDAVDWRAVYEACAFKGGTKWIVVEQETYPDGKPAMQCTQESLAGLKALLK